MEEVPLLKKRKAGTRDSPRPKLPDLAGNGSSTGASVPSDPKKKVIKIEDNVPCKPPLLQRTLSVTPTGRWCWMPRFPGLSRLGHLIGGLGFKEKAERIDWSSRSAAT
ncbi:hypothetical protein Adt_42152 [Abeliophyllum distichum]|uniref:Uncharacterized protein n=1 Tax=Abeliophyllum distichum TaxID=126358 RepID=A0ABD1PUT0_9LAMI